MLVVFGGEPGPAVPGRGDEEKGRPEGPVAAWRGCWRSNRHLSIRSQWMSASMTIGSCDGPLGFSGTQIGNGIGGPGSEGSMG